MSQERLAKLGKMVGDFQQIIKVGLCHAYPCHPQTTSHAEPVLVAAHGTGAHLHIANHLFGGWLVQGTPYCRSNTRNLAQFSARRMTIKRSLSSGENSSAARLRELGGN